ncbi:MAG: flagellar motor switch protein FliN [Methylocapsa sp.]|nr:flagellar motor switch protein FliN [Methylocapsa sp.]
MSNTEFQSAEMEAAREALQSDPRNPNLDSVLRIPVTVQVVLGTATMPVSSLLKLGRGAVIALDRRIGEPVDVVVNGRTIAKGELVVVEEENSRFGISLKEIMGSSGAPE